MKTKRLVQSYNELETWYNEYFNEHGTWPTSPLYANIIIGFILNQFANNLRDCNLLDVACGSGYFLENTSHMFLKAKGVDLSFVAIEEGRVRNPSLDLEVGNGEDLDFKSDSFDVVTCLGSLEHYLSVDRGMQEINRVLKCSGLAAILVPTDYAWLELDVQPVETVLTIEEWSRLLELNDFQVLNIYDTTKYDELSKYSNKCHVFIIRKH